MRFLPLTLLYFLVGILTALCYLLRYPATRERERDVWIGFIAVFWWLALTVDLLLGISVGLGRFVRAVSGRFQGGSTNEGTA